MAAYSHSFRVAAEAARRAAEWTRLVCASVGVSGSAHWLYAACFFEMLARVSGDLAADPPRYDFDTTTRAGARHATPAFVVTERPVEDAAIGTAVAADQSVRYLSAHLRAFERFQGARGSRTKTAKMATALRREEAVDFAEQAGRALNGLADSLSGLTDFLPPKWTTRLTPEHQNRISQLNPSDIEDDALALLFLGGLRVNNLQDALTPISELSSPDSARTEVEGAPQVFRDLAGQLTRWSPPRRG